MPRRNAPPPPSVGEPKTTPQPSLGPRGGDSGGQLGAFWSTMHAKDSLVPEEKGKPMYDEERSSHHISSKHDKVRPDNDQLPKNVGTKNVANTQTQTVKSNIHGKLHKPDAASSKDFEINFFPDTDHASQRHMSNLEKKNDNFQDQTFNTFVAEFDTTKLNSGHGNKSTREEALESEVEKLKEQLKDTNLEKSEITAKYEKLTAICRSQRQELQDLKQALAARTPSPNREISRTSPGVASPASLVISIL
jgi:AP2-associated kinase